MEAVLPVSVDASYLYGGEQFDMMDYIAPVYIILLGMFFVFLLACVAFLRERSQGTIERLSATPATRFEIVLGYMLGLGLFGLIQVAVILFFTVWVIGIHYNVSLALTLLIVAFMAVVGVNLGILASAFARTEFQVLQFIPLVIFPQVLLGGTFWAVSDMPTYLQPFAYAMPIYYATGNRRKAFLYSFLSGLAEPLGAVAGYLILSSIWTPVTMGVVLAGVAGIMVFISLDELLPAAEKYGEHHLATYGLIAGMAVMALSLQLICAH